MADDNIKSTESSFKSATKSANDFQDAVEKGMIPLRELMDSFEGNVKKGDKAFTKLTRTMNRLHRQVVPAVKEFNALDTILESTEKGMKGLEVSYARAFAKGNKQSMLAHHAIAKQGTALRDVTREAKATANEIDLLSKEFKDYTDAILLTSKALEKNKQKQKELQAQKALSDKDAEALKELTLEIGLQEEAINKASKAAEEHRTNSMKLTQEYGKHQIEILEVTKALESEVRQVRQTQRELNKLAGGFGSIKAHMQDITESKFGEWLKNVATPTALLAAGVATVVKGMTTLSDHAKAVSRVALTLGDTSQIGFGRLQKSAQEAGKTLGEMRIIGAKLGYSYDEMLDTMNRVRSSIRMDRDGQLGEQAIQNLSREAAYFSRVSGVELAESVDMLSVRIKRFGMSNAEAVADMQNMRNAIMQMTAGGKHNLVAMTDMVNIIQDASMASQSYVVDTRIMTQALRGAVNQAQELGAAQAQAQDIAKAMGNVMSKSPEYIKIPAGMEMINQLLGGDSDKILSQLDAGTKKQVTAMMDSIRRGETGRFSGAKAIMDLIGQTEAGVEIQSRHLEKTLLGSSEAATLIAQQYGIENASTALEVTNMMKGVVEMRKLMGDEGVGFSTLMAKDTALFKTALDEATDKIGALEKLGLSKEHAQEYFELVQKGVQATKDIELDATLSAEEKKKAIFEATTKAQTLKLDSFLRPTKQILKDLGSKDKAWDVTAKIATKDFDRIGIKSGEDLAKRLGVKYDEHKSILDKMYSEGATAKEIRAQKATLDAIAEKTREAAESAGQGETPLDKIASYTGQMVGSLQSILGPIGQMALGLAGVSAAMYMMYRGQKGIMEWALNNISEPIFKGTARALREQSQGPDGKEPPPSLESPEDKKKRKKKPFRERMKEGWGRRKKAFKGTGIKGLFKGAGKRALGGGIGAALASIPTMFDMFGMATDSSMSGADKAGGLAKSGSSLLGTLGLGAAGSSVGTAIGSAVGTLAFPVVGTAIGGALGSILGGGLGAWGGGEIGDAVGDAIAPVFSNLFTDVPKTTGISPSTLPPALAMGLAGGGTSQPQVGRSLPSGISPRSREMLASAGPNAISPTGDLTLKIINFQDVMSQATEKKSSWGIFK
jgi:hypothetical protein